MDSCSYESMSTISERIFNKDQHNTDQQTRSGSLNSRSKNIKNSFRKKKNQVFLEGYVEASDEDDLVRAKSLTDEDLDELKGCFDLGFGFSYDEIPELCNTLPALELCYSMSQKFLDDQKSPEMSSSPATVPEEFVSPPPPAPIANWKISSPGDHPEEVKARLKYWAQAVACTVKLCN
ncbi:hypothetical protein M8C21_030534 [Ambrosia artemisiifolia]|uniref:Uncharacterized protein n=1 Tax=Ambrosia artemisiifolia TaxID=4212 RepID=A0AAD5GG10_AMBAR|nr:hypothetical protein M8C21_030534 [Ambrosia artemisiifolia]